MDLQVQSESFTSADYRWLASKNAVTTAKSATLVIPTAGNYETTLYPDGYLKPGTLLAKYTSGANSGKWGVYVNDDTVAEGLGTIAGIALDDFKIRKDQAGALVNADTVGAVLLPHTGIQVHVSKLPGLLDEDNTTAHVVVAADLETAANVPGFAAVDLM